MVKQSKTKTKSYQIKMDEDVHGLLKKRAKDLQMTIGEFIQNMLGAFENRLSDLKAEYGFDAQTTNNELDAKLFKVLLLVDAKILPEEDIPGKIESIKGSFQSPRYRPEITINDDDV